MTSAFNDRYVLSVDESVLTWMESTDRGYRIHLIPIADGRFRYELDGHVLIDVDVPVARLMHKLNEREHPAAR